MVRVLNFDNSVTRQKRLLAHYDPQVIDLTDIAPSVRFWSNGKDRGEVKGRIGTSNRGAVTFLGSGDFHHVSEIILSSFEEPLVLIDFDLHPDRSVIAPRYSCGSWVRTALNNKNILKIIQIGTKHSSVKDLPGLYSAFKDLPARKAYITIDKDCLAGEFALTNWHEGKMALDEILAMLKLIKENLDIAGVDITGEYSPVRISGVVKRVIAYLNRPKDFSAKGIPEPRIDAINEETNLKILETLTQAKS